MRWRAPALALLLLSLAALACALPAARTPVPPTPTAAPLPPVRVTPDAAPLAGTPAATLPARSFPSFAPFRLTPRPPTGETAAYRLRLERVQNEAALSRLSERERELLAARGFIAAPAAYETFGALYRDATEMGYPLLLTADVALYTLDVIADVAWQRAEMNLVPHLQALSEGMAAAAQEQWESAPDETLATAAWTNLAYFSIGSRLLDATYTVPAAVADIVDEELTLIRQGRHFISPLRGAQLDYGQLQPVGTYAATPALARFYQARQWYSLPFVLDAEQPVRTRLQALQLALMALALDTSRNLPRWHRVYEPLAYDSAIGEARNLLDVRAALTAVGGETAFEADRLDDLAATLLVLPELPAEATVPVSEYVFLPPPSSLAQTLLPSLVFNRVGRYTGDTPLPLTAVETAIGPIRAVPRVFDIAAALGSAEARAWLDAGGDSLYEGYDSQLAVVATTLEGVGPDTYDSGWLVATMPLLSRPEGELTYTGNQAWMQHKLNTWLGGWVLLHHDTELLPRPVGYVPAESAPLPGFVEAEPELYAALAALAGQLEEGLRTRDLLDDEAGQKLLQLERLYRGLEEIAAASLAGAPLDDDALLLLAQLAPRLEGLLTFAPLGSGVPRVDAPLPRKTTTYTDPASGAQMVARLGPVWLLYVLVEREGALWVAVGGIYTTGEERRAGAAEERAGAEAGEPSPWLLPLLEATSPP
jgi:hypothetical protein